MAYDIPAREPTEATIGSSWYWDATYSGFPASEGWVLTYYLRGASDLTLANASPTGVTITADGDVYEVRIPGTVTAAVTSAGKFRLIGRVALAGEVHVVYNEHLLLHQDPLDAVNAKTFARQMLEAIEAAMVAGISTSSDIQSITINGRSISYRDRDELNRLHAHYSLLVAIEENPHGTLSHAAQFVRG